MGFGFKLILLKNVLLRSVFVNAFFISLELNSTFFSHLF